MTLTEFLLARIGDDVAGIADYSTPGRFFGTSGQDCDVVVGRDRALAECEAKRRIVYANAGLEAGVQRETLRWLAHPYADHPDYRDEWRP